MNEVWQNLIAPQNIIFAGALILLLILFVIQLISLISGFEIFSFLDSAFDVPDMDIELDADPTGISHQFFSMLNLGKVPVIISFILFLFLFSCIGYNIQFVLKEMGLFLLPWFLITPASFILTLPILRIGNGILSKIMPKDETAAVSSDLFIGRMATIVIGTVTSKKQSEAKLTGPNGRTHYIQVIAANNDEVFHQGENALIASKDEGLFSIIKPQNKILNK